MNTAYRLLIGCVLTVALSIPAFAVELLADPFLQAPTATSTKVVWFTEFEGVRHLLVYGDGLDHVTGMDLVTLAARRGVSAKLRVVAADTSKLSRMREDEGSRVPGRIYDDVTDREIWRHEAVAANLVQGLRVPYAVVSFAADGTHAISEVFTLAPLPAPGMPMKILLTSDHQSKAMTPANLQKVQEMIGRVDAVFFAGDLVNVPDRASEWFDDARGGAFFPGLQGNASRSLTHGEVTTVYEGGEIIQHAPLYPVIGNHEVMGRVKDAGLNSQFGSPVPTEVAERAYEANAAQINPANDAAIRDQWIVNNSFNADSYLELFTLPEHASGTEKWYAETIGDVRLVSLYATRIWRTPNVSGRSNGKYVEGTGNLGDELEQGWGTFIFEPIAGGSEQYEWFEQELMSPEFQQAKFKVVMFHHPVHNLGGNVVPSFTDPVRIEERDAEGNLVGVRYEYPKQDNYLVRDLDPLFEQAGVDLVFNGHNHVWNRFVGPTGVNYLETSNVGNSYGGYVTGRRARGGMPPAPWIQSDYDAYDDPYGFDPVMPNLAPLLDDEGAPYPYVADNSVSVFTIFDTATGSITSYAYDTKDPQSEVWVLDRFSLE